MWQNRFIISYYAPPASFCPLHTSYSIFYPFARFDGFLPCLFNFLRIELNLYPGAEDIRHAMIDSRGLEVLFT